MIFYNLSHEFHLWRDLQSMHGVSPLLEGPPPAGLVSFQMHAEAEQSIPSELVKTLGAKQIWIRDLADPICLRACTHVCTSHNDMEQLTQGIRRISTENQGG